MAGTRMSIPDVPRTGSPVTQQAPRRHGVELQSSECCRTRSRAAATSVLAEPGCQARGRRRSAPSGRTPGQRLPDVATAQERMSTPGFIRMTKRQKAVGRRRDSEIVLKALSLATTRSTRSGVPIDSSRSASCESTRFSAASGVRREPPDQPADVGASRVRRSAATEVRCCPRLQHGEPDTGRCRRAARARYPPPTRERGDRGPDVPGHDPHVIGRVVELVRPRLPESHEHRRGVLGALRSTRPATYDRATRVHR